MDGRHLVELAEWIESFLDRTKAMPEHWYELHHSAQDFWDLLPDVLLRLLRRSYALLRLLVLTLLITTTLGLTNTARTSSARGRGKRTITRKTHC